MEVAGLYIVAITVSVAAFFILIKLEMIADRLYDIFTVLKDMREDSLERFNKENNSE